MINFPPRRLNADRSGSAASSRAESRWISFAYLARSVSSTLTVASPTMRLRSRPLFADAAVGAAGNVFQFVADSLPVPHPANVVHPLSSANGYVVVACKASAAFICASDKQASPVSAPPAQRT